MQNPADDAVWHSLTNSISNQRTLWRDLLPWLRALVRKRVASFRFDEQTEDDIVLHVASKLLTAKLISLPSLKAWISRVSFNKATDISRQQKRRARLVSSHPDIAASAVAETGDIATAEDTRELMEMLKERAAEELNDQEKMLFEILTGLTKKRGYVVNIAAELGLTPNAAHQRLFRLRRKLRRWAHHLRDDNRAVE